VTSGHWTSPAPGATGTTRTAGAAADPDTPAGRTAPAVQGSADDGSGRVTLVSLRVLGLGADVRTARRGSVEPALDVVLR
jgi:hypothetical protein